MTEDQRFLCAVTRMYDNANEHSECPSETVLNDDDAFDGWMIFERRKAEKARDKQSAEDMMGGRHEGAGEVFLFAKTKEDRQRIEGLNDQEAKITKKKRQALIKQQGAKGNTVRQSQFQDERIELQNRYNEMFKTHVKG